MVGSGCAVTCSSMLYSTFVVMSAISDEFDRNRQMAPISRFGSRGPVIEFEAKPRAELIPTAASSDRNTSAFVSWKKTTYLVGDDVTAWCSMR